MLCMLSNPTQLCTASCIKWRVLRTADAATGQQNETATPRCSNAMPSRVNRALTYLTPIHISCIAAGQPLHCAPASMQSLTILHTAQQQQPLRIAPAPIARMLVPGCPRMHASMYASCFCPLSDHDQQLMHASVSHAPCSRVPRLGSQVQHTRQYQYSMIVHS